MIEDKELDALIEAKNTVLKNTNVFKHSKDDDENQSITTKLVQQGVQSAIVHKLKNEQEIQEKFLGTADKVITTNISKVVNEAEKNEKLAIYENHKDACDLYGINEKTVPKWVVKACVTVQNFWYAMWIVIGFFTIAPVVFVSKKIKIIVKHTWIAVIIALIVYAAIITSPLWLKYLQFDKTAIELSNI